nr:immunoglobulin light chain junction region [Macaca mulatta]MOV64939.1 immunoglobulin light chain junction region [Macaca mulatta]
CQQYSYWKTF